MAKTAKEPIAVFNVRIYEGDEINLKQFDEIAEERGAGREEMVRQLMRGFLTRQGEEEQHYTIKGYSADHKKAADIENYGGDVWLHRTGFDDDEDGAEWTLFEHAKDLVERGGPGDKEEAIALFQQVFGERNVFLKKGD